MTDTTHWVLDEKVSQCGNCEAIFSMLKRKHHCRKCGNIFCSECSKYFVYLSDNVNKVRVCESCKDLISLKNDNLSAQVDGERDDSASAAMIDASSPEEKTMSEWEEILQKNNRDEIRYNAVRGLPAQLRSYIWTKLCNVQEKKSHSSKYNDLLSLVQASLPLTMHTPQTTETSPTSSSSFSPPSSSLSSSLSSSSICELYDTIYIDCIRTTFKEEPAQITDSECSSICQLLCVFSYYFPNLGYMQGMTYLARVLLQHVNNNEDAFWCLVSLFTDIDMLHVYTPPDKPKGLLRLLNRVSMCMDNMLPDLANHLRKQATPIESVISQWLRTLFSYNFPAFFIVSVWDIILCEGLDVTVWISMLIMEEAKGDLLALTNTSLLLYFKDIPSHVIDNVLLRVQKKKKKMQKNIA